MPSVLDADIEAVSRDRRPDQRTRSAELAKQIDADYADREPLLVGVLKGAVMFMSDLARTMSPAVDDGVHGGELVRIVDDLVRAWCGSSRTWTATSPAQHVLIVEDIIDSGLTLSWLLKNLHSRNPGFGARSSRCSANPTRSRSTLPVEYVGFDIPNEFVVGYGLDYAERYRDLPYIGRLQAVGLRNPGRAG